MPCWKSSRRSPVLLLVIGLAGCSCSGNQGDSSSNPGGDPGKTAGTKKTVRTVDEPATLPLDIPLPAFELVDSSGEAFSSDRLEGHPWVASFIFTRCTLTCPEQTRRMKEVQRRLADREQQQTGSTRQGGPMHFLWDHVRVVSISVDPGHDTSEVLANYAAGHEADPARWTFLTGDREAIHRLCRDGFKLPAAVSDEPENPITHSARVALVDHRGHLRGLYPGTTDEGIARLMAGIELVLAERVVLPPQIVHPGWLEGRRQEQLKAARSYKVFHDFGFVDRQPDSGIDFRHRVVDDGGRSYRPVHYDHGNGVAVADVDGDGRLDLYFVNQVGSNRLYRNLGGARFEDITGKAGVAMSDTISVTASFADIDNDGDADLYVTSVRTGNRLFLNDGHGRFDDISRISGVAHQGHSSAAVFFDYDRDGKLDLFLANVGRYTNEKLRTVVNDRTDAGRDEGQFRFYDGLSDAFVGHLHANRNERSLLFRNKGGGHFEDVTESVGLDDISWSGDASPIDANQDGWPDLYVLNMQGHDEYYENVEGKKFIRKSRELFPKTSWGAMGIKVFDFDNDGLMDIFITDMHSDMGDDHLKKMQDNVDLGEEKLKSPPPFPESLLKTEGNSLFGNSFFRGVGPGRFEEISDTIGAENYWPWGLSVGDLNADGFQDAFLTSSMNFPWRYHPNSVLLNEGGKVFRDAEFVVGVEPRRGGRTAIPWFVHDTSGRTGDNPFLDPETYSGKFVMYGALGSRSSVIFDLDGDGDLDIVTNDFNSEPLVLISNLAERRTVRRLAVRLTGTTSNRDGLGARVSVKTAGGTYRQVNDGQSGYLSQSRMPLYFGLGDAETVESVEVAWPSGRIQQVAGPIPIGPLLEITESEQ